MTNTQDRLVEADDAFLCEGCGGLFPEDERAEEFEPYCVECWMDDPNPGSTREAGDE